jgi:hypothetical protein
MSLFGIVTVLHVVGAAVGVGGATAADALFLRSIRDRRIGTDQYVLLRGIQKVVLGGLALVVLTGVALVLRNAELVREAEFQAKMVAVGALLLNGFAFHLRVEPWLERHLDRRMEEVTLRRRLPLFSVVGPLSIVSWYTALVLGASDDLGFSLAVFLLLYAGALAAAMAAAYLVLSRLARSGREEKGAHGEGGGFPWTVALLSVLVLLFAGTLVVAARAA